MPKTPRSSSPPSPLAAATPAPPATSSSRPPPRTPRRSRPTTPPRAVRSWLWWLLPRSSSSSPSSPWPSSPSRATSRASASSTSVAATTSRAHGRRVGPWSPTSKHGHVLFAKGASFQFFFNGPWVSVVNFTNNNLIIFCIPGGRGKLIPTPGTFASEMDKWGSASKKKEEKVVPFFLQFLLFFFFFLLFGPSALLVLNDFIIVGAV